MPARAVGRPVFLFVFQNVFVFVTLFVFVFQAITLARSWPCQREQWARPAPPFTRWQVSWNRTSQGHFQNHKSFFLQNPKKCKRREDQKLSRVSKVDWEKRKQVTNRSPCHTSQGHSKDHTSFYKTKETQKRQKNCRESTEFIGG